MNRKPYLLISVTLLVIAALLLIAAQVDAAPLATKTPPGKTWVCFQTAAGRIVKCAWLPNWLAYKLPCKNCK